MYYYIYFNPVIINLYLYNNLNYLNYDFNLKFHVLFHNYYFNFNMGLKFNLNNYINPSNCLNFYLFNLNYYFNFYLLLLNLFHHFHKINYDINHI